jgi:hypothetical protein
MFQPPVPVPSERLTITRRFLLPLLTVALTLTALLAPSAPADAAQLDLVGGSTFGSPSLYPYQQWTDDSYAPTYPGTVRLTFSPALLTCGTATGAVGCTNWSEWPLPPAVAAARPAQVDIDTGNGPSWAHQYLMHELGHVFDATEMQDPLRADFMTIWGLPGGPTAWWTPFGGGHRSAGEWFAESYKLCALYGPKMLYEAWRTDSPAYGFPGDHESAKQDTSCRLMLQVGAVEGLPTPASPTVYTPRVLVQANRKAAECPDTDLLLLGKQVRCERAGGGSPAGPWNIILQTRRLNMAELRRAHLRTANGQPAFAPVHR